MTTVQNQSFLNRRVLKFNIGFLLAQGAGHQKDIDLDLPRIRVDEDLDLDYVRGPLRFSRNSRGILIQGDLEASVAAECSRCLTPTSVPVSVSLEELFAYPPDPEMDYSVDDTGILDLAPLLREETILATPMVIVCHDDCAGLCPICGQNFNEGTCDCEQEEIDPRLEALRALKDDDSH
ncbi:YceD family protein [Aggregatilinea lenta]|uniref:YceD family protein n=1 Tax=Aggregatilinea lenta TaxID=913108 RepID=UPI000E5A9CB1|nr:DUF177 domain-containing protein [Aggregatilinea lenta]